MAHFNRYERSFTCRPSTRTLYVNLFCFGTSIRLTALNEFMLHIGSFSCHQKNEMIRKKISFVLFLYILKCNRLIVTYIEKKKGNC